MKKKNNQELEDIKNQLARVLADYDNLKKRHDEERLQMYKLASISVILKVFPIIDSLIEAQKHIKDSGLAIIIGQLESLARDEGFEMINLKEGDKFDENICEVIEVVETLEEKDDNSVSEIVLSGWRHKDGTVVRHVKVKVFKLKELKAEN